MDLVTAVSKVYEYLGVQGCCGWTLFLGFMFAVSAGLGKKKPLL